MEKAGKVLVTGGGGFIGGHLVSDLLATGHSDVRVVDRKPRSQWYQVFPQAENVSADLQELHACRAATRDVRYVFNLAADMGGMGFIETHKAECMLSVLISTHMLMAAREAAVERFFYSSSACVYAAEKQTRADVVALREERRLSGDARGRLWVGEAVQRADVPAFPRGLRATDTRVLDIITSTVPDGTYDGGREKAPAAICRKVIEAKLSGAAQIEIWGDGNQTRSFMYIDDCITGTQMILDSEETEPLNLGSDQLVSINQLVDIVEAIGGIKLKRVYNLSAPKGVRGRNSDNTLIKERLHWAPSITLDDGLEQTYRWIYDQITAGKKAA